MRTRATTEPTRSGQPAARALAATLSLAAVALTACGDAAIRTSSPAGPAAEAARACHVTRPGGDLPAAARGFDYGNRLIGVKLWPHGRLVAGPGPDGGSVATINADGSISTKLGWWRGVEGPLRVTGKRLDSAAPPLSADVPDGYEPTGFQPTGLRFPTTGCWKVSGRVGGGHLSFVVRVSKRR